MFVAGLWHSSVSAEDYFWTSAHTGTQPFNSPAAACAAATDIADDDGCCGGDDHLSGSQLRCAHLRPLGIPMGLSEVTATDVQ